MRLVNVEKQSLKCINFVIPSGMSPTAVMVASCAAAAMAPVTREEKRRRKRSQTRKESEDRLRRRDESEDRLYRHDDTDLRDRSFPGASHHHRTGHRYNNNNYSFSSKATMSSPTRVVAKELPAPTFTR